ncbi:MAG: recombinase family protein [Ruthenibacterium lactatiformans]
MRAGLFDIVLCKSQSRFTREMELVEKYIHGLFVEWSVRFVGYADNADTANRGNKKARQINGLVNEWYLEDMSQNIRTVLDAKRRQGEFVGSFASYGYRKDPKDKHRLLVDEPAAAVVRRIYALYLSGWGASRIAAQLNREQVPNPSAYKSRTTRLSTGAAPPRWQSLERFHRAGHPEKQVYTGTTVQHVNEKISYKSKRLRRLPLSAGPWCRNPCGGHRHGNMGGRSAEAGGGSGQRREGRRDALAGKCRARAAKLQSKYGRAENTCGAAPTLWPRPGVSIRRDEAAQCVLEALQDCMARYLDRNIWRGICVRRSCGAQAGTAGARAPAGAGAGTPARRRTNAYEDRVDGAVTAAQFAELSAAFEAEIARLGKELAAAERERGAAAEQAAQCVTAEQLVKKYARADVLTDEMAECMVEAVLVGRPERQRRPVPLEIRWRF